MMNFRVCLLFILGYLVLVNSAGAAELSIQIEANRTKVNDAPWDGLAGVGAGKGAIFFGIPTVSPPDLAICIVTATLDTNCITRKEGRKIISLCQNSYDCDFPGIKVEQNVFGLVIIDLDERQNDFVDAVLLINDDTGDLSGIADLEVKVRSEVSRLAPALTAGERERRERPFQKFSVAQCAGSKECTLRQSTLRIDQ